MARTEARGTRSRLVLAVLLLVPAAAHGQQTSDSVFAACVGRDTTAEWRKVSAAWQRGSGTPADPALRDRLIELARRDQRVRQVPGIADSLRSGTYIQHMTAVDSAGAAALHGIVDEYGWPTRAMVGLEGSTAALLLVQHNPAIQEWALQLMLALPRGEVSPMDLATLEDRVRLSRGQPQIYGTQLHATPGGRTMVFGPITDLEHLDARRAERGLYPLNAYICLIERSYGLKVEPPRP